MRYRSVALIQPNSRTGNIGYLVPHRKNVKKNVVHYNSAPSSSKKGSGVLEDADELYLKQKSEGQGLRLAGQGHGCGLSPPGGGAIMLDGNGLDLPGGSLRSNLLNAIPKNKKKKIIQSVDRGLGSAYSIGTSNSMGMGKKKKVKSKRGKGLQGMGDAESLNKIQSMLSDNIIPKLMEKMGVADVVPQKLIDKVVETSTSKPSNTIKDVISDLSKKIMPIVTQSKLAQAGVTSGGAYKKIVKSKKYNKLHGHMAKYLASEVMGQDGSGFFGDLWSGFKSIIKPIASIAGPIASVLLPEFSAPIGMATKIIGSL